MNEHATIRVTRDSRRRIDRRRAYRVFVDETPLGEVRRGERVEYPVPPGRHVVRVSFESAHSRDWEIRVRSGDVVSFVCRSRRSSGSHVDVFLADASDERAALLPVPDRTEHDAAVKQRVLTRDGAVLDVWAHRSGYLRSLDPGTSENSDAFGQLAYIVFVLPRKAASR